MSLVAAELVGGLGNQMFVLATQFAFAKRSGKMMFVDSSQKVSPSNVYRKTYWHTPLLTKLLHHPIVFDLAGHQKTLNDFHWLFFQEKQFSFKEIPQFENNVILKGYFQSEKYFQDAQEEILFLFGLDESDARLRKNMETVSVHIRRGDYLSLSQIHRVLPIDYYKRAIENFPNAKRFLFFSDDIDWVVQNETEFCIPKTSNFEICMIEDELDAFLEMQSCGAGHIIANSSFSWWAAYLGFYASNENKKVVAPAVWFGPDGPSDTFDIFLRDWIQI
jgi:hypothetical protein